MRCIVFCLLSYFITSVAVSATEHKQQNGTVQNNTTSLSRDGSAKATRTLLFTAIRERLHLMDEVAIVKHREHLSTVDKQRENLLLKKAVQDAQSYHLDGPSIEQFLGAQISVAKAIQFRFRAFLETHPHFLDSAGGTHTLASSPSSPNSLNSLNTLATLRPKISHHSDATIKILADYIREHGPLTAQHQQEFTIIVEHPQVTLADKQFLFQALKQARLKTPQPNTLSTVVE